MFGVNEAFGESIECGRLEEVSRLSDSFPRGSWAVFGASRGDSTRNLASAIVRVVAVTMEYWARICLARCLRRQSPRPSHSLAGVVEKRIMSEVSLYGICPRARFGTCPLLLSQNDKDGCRGVPDRTRSEQPKASNSMGIGFGDVLGPAVDEIF